jgi:hypothetical protein
MKQTFIHHFGGGIWESVTLEFDEQQKPVLWRQEGNGDMAPLSSTAIGAERKRWRKYVCSVV